MKRTSYKPTTHREDLCEFTTKTTFTKFSNGTTTYYKLITTFHLNGEEIILSQAYASSIDKLEIIEYLTGIPLTTRNKGNHRP